MLYMTQTLIAIFLAIAEMPRICSGQAPPDTPGKETYQNKEKITTTTLEDLKRCTYEQHFKGALRNFVMSTTISIILVPKITTVRLSANAGHFPSR